MRKKFKNKKTAISRNVLAYFWNFLTVLFLTNFKSAHYKCKIADKSPFDHLGLTFAWECSLFLL